MAVQNHPHGTRGRYRAGCRCTECRQWKSDDNAKYRASSAPAETEEPAEPAKPTRSRRARPSARPTSDAPRGRRAVLDDPLAQLIEDTFWEEHGNPWAVLVVAERIRDAGYRIRYDGPIEHAAREALEDRTADPATRMRHELVFRGAKSLDDPDNARYYASTVDAMRKVLADLAGPDGDGGGDDIVEAIRRAARDGEGDSSVDDTEEPEP